MSSRDLSKKWGQPAPGDASEEDDGVASLGFSNITSGRSETSSLYSTTKANAHSEFETRKCDDDSGVCNSSKATNSVGSFSDDESDDEDRSGMFDYFPQQVKIRNGRGMVLDYDEVHEVKSDHSSPDVNSPRSDISDGTELIEFPPGSHRANEDTDDDFNFRREHANFQDDFDTDKDSDEDAHDRYYNLGYRPLSRDVPGTYRPHFTSSGLMDGDRYRSLRASQADEGINFSLSDHASQYSRYGQYYPKASEKVKIEKNSYKKDPPFGNGPEQLHKVGSSINDLIAHIPSEKVKNMPEGRRLEVLQPEENRRKKKKKKTSKGKTGNYIIKSERFFFVFICTSCT